MRAHGVMSWPRCDGAIAVAIGLLAVAATLPVRAADAAPPLPAPYTGAVVEGEFASFQPGHWEYPTVQVVANSHGIDIWLRSLTSELYLGVLPPEGSNLTVGTYEGAQQASIAAPGHPGLELDGPGRTCSPVTGRFIIDQLEWLPSGDVAALSLRFEHHCGVDPATHGVVSYSGDRAVPQPDDLTQPARRVRGRGSRRARRSGSRSPTTARRRWPSPRRRPAVRSTS